MPSDGTQSPLPADDPGEIDRALRHVSVLVVDDEPGMSSFVRRTLGPHCTRVEEAADTATASALLNAQHFDLVILDNVMPGQSGLDWLSDQRRVGLFAEVIVITAYADLETSIHALRVGAADFVPKPFRAARLLEAAARCMAQRRLRHESYRARHGLHADRPGGQVRLIGKSPAMARIRETLERVAPQKTPVLISGESGTGKDVAAQVLHAMSPRADRPFITVGCAGIPADQITDDLFGRAGEAGLLQQATGGTLFLDEIGELPLSVQAMLLRVIETGCLRPAGSDREVPLDLRFVLSTTLDLQAAVAEGRFRTDLYHRIAVLSVDLPPLRDRVGDIEELAGLFMGTQARQLGLGRLPLTQDVIVGLARHGWPGNLRELRNVIERSLILGAFPAEFSAGDSGRAAPAEALAEVERRHILSVLAACGGNRAEAARRLGVSRKTIDRKFAMWKL